MARLLAALGALRGQLGGAPGPPAPAPPVARTYGALLTAGASTILATDWPPVAGTLTSPPAPFSLIFQSAVIAPGVYTVNWTVTLSGTVSTPELNNFILNLGPSNFLASSSNPAAAGTYPQAPVTFSTPGGLRLLLLTGGNNATPGAVYGGNFAGSGGEGLAVAGPTGIGSLWTPRQVAVSTSTNISTPEAFLYLGPLLPAAALQSLMNTPQLTQIGGTSNGSNDSIGLIGIQVPQGQALIVQWIGGDAGATAIMTITGDQVATYWR